MKKRNTIHHNSYITIVLGLWFATEVLFQSTIDKFLYWDMEDINKYASYLFLLLLTIYILFFQEYSMKEIISIGVVSTIVIITTIHAHHNIMMSTFIFIIAAKNMDFESTAKLVYYAQVASVILVIALFWSGNIGENIIYRGAVIRHSYGFLHPNLFGIRMFHIMTNRCYLRRNKIGFSDFASVLIMALIVRHVSDSKTAYYSLLALLFIIMLYSFLYIREVNMDVFAKVMIIISFIMCSGSLVLSFIDVRKNSIISVLDAALSHRFSLCHKTLLYYGIKLFGQEISPFVKRPQIASFYRFYLDNSYMAILLRYGYFIFICFILAYFYTMVNLRKRKQYFLVGMMGLFTVYGVMENNLFSMSQNVFLLLLSFSIYGEHTESFSKNHKKVVFVWQ